MLVGHLVAVLSFIESPYLPASLLFLSPQIDFVLLSFRILLVYLFFLSVFYMPGEYLSSSLSDYLNTLGELDGFINSQNCDGLVIVGDFNVDFCRQGPLHNLLVDFMSDHDLVARDLPFQGSIGHTYERDDGNMSENCGQMSEVNYTFPAPLQRAARAYTL